MEKSKITKAMVLTAIKEADLTKVDFGAEVTAEDVVAYAEVTLAQLAAKAAKAKEKAAEKKATGDVLKGKILAVMNSMEPDRFATADEILEAVNDEDATKSKIVARLSQLVKEGIVVKELVKLDEGKRMSYKLA